MRGKTATKLRQAAESLVRATLKIKEIQLEEEDIQYLIRQQYKDLKKRIRRK